MESWKRERVFSVSIPATLMAISMATSKLKLNSFVSIVPSSTSLKRPCLKPVYCASFPQTQQQEDIGIICEPCNDKGWLLCDFCNGQKINVKAINNRIYRRCPSCRAIGYVLCSKCKVFKCVTFPNYSDDEL